MEYGMENKKYRRLTSKYIQVFPILKSCSYRYDYKTCFFVIFYMKILHGGCLPHEFIFDVFFSNIVYNSEHFFNFLGWWSSGLKSKSYSIIGQKFGKMLNIIMEFWEIKSTFAGGGGYLPFVKPFGVKITLDYRPKYPKKY